MTRLPVERVRLGKGAHHPVDLGGTVCANPWCDNDATDIHHIVRRSELIGAYDAVEIDGELQPNVCGLCRGCHNRITENRDQIVFGLTFYSWKPETSEFGSVKLHPHPSLVRLNASPDTPEPSSPGYSPDSLSGEALRRTVSQPPGSAVGDRSVSSSAPLNWVNSSEPSQEQDPGGWSGMVNPDVTSSANESETFGEGNAGSASPPGGPVSRVPDQAQPGQRCPTCKRRIPKKVKDDLSPLPARKRATWAIRVPKDNQENGAELLDTLVEQAAQELGRADHASFKYFVLVETLHFFLTSPKQ